MITRRFFSAFSFVLITLLVWSPMWADSHVRIVRLSLVDGPVQLDRATGEGFERAIMNMPVAQGMQLWTRDNSRAEVEFEDGTTLRLAPGTKVEFSELVLRTDGTRHTVIRIDSGRAYVNYARTKGEDFRVVVGNQEVALDKSVHFRADVTNDRAELGIISGELNGAPFARAKKNETLVLQLSGSESYQIAKGIDAALEDSWDADRNKDHDKYVRSAYSRGSSFYGASVLDYYGGWLDSPFGSCWRPYGFASSWDPYSSGAWVYYPSYGYSFVSLYPWGWQPYRSGAWNYLGAGYGYCWTPNRNFYGYGWAPVYYAPAGYVAPKPPVRYPGQRGPRDGGLLPVGTVNTSGNWTPSTPIILDRGGRGARGGASSFAGGGSAAPASTLNTADPNRGPRRIPSADQGFSPGQAARANPSNAGSFGPSRAPRPDRGFSGPSGGSHSSAAPMREPARMSAPAPAPAPAPARSAPSGGGGSRGAAPK